MQDSVTQHRVIDGRIFQVVSIEAEDTKAAARHISAQLPVSYTTAREIREAVSK